MAGTDVANLLLRAEAELAGAVEERREYTATLKALHLRDSHIDQHLEQIDQRLERIENQIETHPNGHIQPWGRRSYDPKEEEDLEPTLTGNHVKVPTKTLERMRAGLAAIEAREHDADQQRVGAEKLKKQWKGYVAIGVAIGSPLAAAAFEVLKWWLGGK